MTTLNSRIIMSANIHLDRDYKNIDNESVENFLQVMLDENHLVFQDTKYQFLNYTDNVIRCNCAFQTALNCNYIAFQNTNYSNKWFFAFIDSVEFYSDQMCLVRYTIDACRTFFNDLRLNDCFVIREHTNDDTIGKNTIPEDIPVGRVKQIESEIMDEDLYNNCYIALETTFNLYNAFKGGDVDFIGVSRYNRQVFGSEIYLFDLTNQGCIDLIYTLNYIQSKKSNLDSVFNLFIIPSAVIDKNNLETIVATWTHGSESLTWNIVTIKNYSNTSTYKEFNIQKTKTFDITIKNNKCYCYPYSYLLVSNNNGNQNIYKYEDWLNSDTASFREELALSIGVSGRLVPTSYKGSDFADDEAIPLGKYPTCSYTSDASTSWLMSQAVNTVTDFTGIIAKTTESSLGSYNTGGGNRFKETGGKHTKSNRTASLTGLDAINTNTQMALTSQLINKLGAFYLSDLLPNIKQGGNTGDVVFSSYRSSFCFRKMRATNENMRIIDDYFTKYGYKTMRLKIPNVNGRTYFNYVEISDADDIGQATIPYEYMEIINNVFRRGVTVWHKHSYIGRYDVNNSIT